MQQNRLHIKGISGLRAIAIFGIIFYHMYPYEYTGGFLGVSLFFMLSGYLLSIHSEELRKTRSYSVKAFYIKRIKRIYPQLIIVLLSSAALMKYMFPNALIGMRSEVISILFGYNNYWQIIHNASYFERMATITPFMHMWSLSNEVQFYLIWPFIFFWFIFFTVSKGTKTAIRFYLIVAILLSIIMPLRYNPDVDVTAIYYGFDTRLFSFMTGAWLGMRRFHLGKEDMKIKNKVLGIGIFIALFAVLMVAYLIMDGAAGHTYLGGMFAINIVYALMLWLCANEHLPIGAFMENRVFRFFGDISYEMYLWMYPIIFFFTIQHWMRKTWSPFLLLLVVVALSFILQRVVEMLMKKEFGLQGSVVDKLKKSSLYIALVAYGIACVIGIYAVATAPSVNREDKEELRADMESSRQALKNQETENTDTQEMKKSDETDVEESEPEPTGAQISLDGIVAIGDSVMLGAAPALQETIEGCYVDAAESRQTRVALDIIDSLAAQGSLGDTVIIGLGTNGSISAEIGQEIVDKIGKDRKILWINVYGETLQWMDEANDIIYQIAGANDNVYVLDWAGIAAEHREWLYNDGIHLRPEGQVGYAQFVLDSIYALNDNSTGQ